MNSYPPILQEKARSLIVFPSTSALVVSVLVKVTAIDLILLVLVGLAVIAFNYGGNFSLFPLATREAFGSKYISQNYGWVFLSYGVGGILIPMVGAALSGAGHQELAFVISAVGLAITLVLMYLYKKPSKQ